MAPAGQRSACVLSRPRHRGTRRRCAGLLALLLCVGCVHEALPPPRSPMPPGKIAVVGEVARAGLYDYRPGMTLLEAVRLAGGLTPMAAPEHASITRFSGGLQAAAEVRLDRIAQALAPDPPLEEGDAVRVPARE